MGILVGSLVKTESMENMCEKITIRFVIGEKVTQITAKQNQSSSANSIGNNADMDIMQ